MPAALGSSFGFALLTRAALLGEAQLSRDSFFECPQKLDGSWPQEGMWLVVFHAESGLVAWLGCSRIPLAPTFKMGVSENRGYLILGSL